MPLDERCRDLGRPRGPRLSRCCGVLLEDALGAVEAMSVVVFADVVRPPCDGRRAPSKRLNLASLRPAELLNRFAPLPSYLPSTDPSDVCR